MGAVAEEPAFRHEGVERRRRTVEGRELHSLCGPQAEIDPLELALIVRELLA